MFDSTGSSQLMGCMPAMGRLFRVLVLGCLAFAAGAKAEGRCPPGQYPVASNGCAPIPGYGANQPQQSPQIIQRTIYLESNGAVAVEKKSGRYSFVVDRQSRKEAERDALAECNAAVGGGCRPLYWFRNGCGALAWSNGDVYAATSESKEDSVAAVMKKCADKGVTDCELVDVKCSMPMAPPS